MTLRPCAANRKATGKVLTSGALSEHVTIRIDSGLGDAGDSLAIWTQRYFDLAVRGVRSDEVTGKITRHLDRFTARFTSGYGHDWVSAVTPREITAWRDHLTAEGALRRDGTTAPTAPGR